MKTSKDCPVCGNDEYENTEVLWPELINDWQLTSTEVDYVNRQQGYHCTECGNNLRSMSLADAIINRYQFKGTLIDFVSTDFASSLKILEINEAGGLTQTLSSLPGHVLIKYPEYDMMNLQIEDGLFDLVLHSDTLEHIPEPVTGLVQCRKVLNSTGACIYTVPLIIGKLSRSRQGMKDSFHGDSSGAASDLLVYTEFGADAWKYAIEADFNRVTIHNFEYPSAFSIEAIV